MEIKLVLLQQKVVFNFYVIMHFLSVSYHNLLSQLIAFMEIFDVINIYVLNKPRNEGPGFTCIYSSAPAFTRRSLYCIWSYMEVFHNVDHQTLYTQYMLHM